MVNSMVDFAPKKTSPLDGVASPSGVVTLAEKRFVGKVNIRGNADDAAFAGAAETVLGTVLPVTPNTVAQARGYTVFWLGPDEWLIHTPEDAQSSLILALQAAFAGQHSAVTDVSDYYVIIEMRGDHARDILARGCPLDLHERTFKPGHCAQSYFANAAILLHQVDGGAYDIQVRWTFAQYLWDYLSQCAEQMVA